MPSLDTIPLEMRHEIYSYLLLLRRAVKESDQTVGLDVGEQRTWLIPDISTALFRVNRQISSESIEYFYGENAFVALASKICRMAPGAGGLRSVAPTFELDPLSVSKS